MAQPIKTGQEIFRPGEPVKYSGEYVLMDEQGNRQDFDLVTLDEGETFPQIPGGQNLCYVLNDTCFDEPCDIT